MSEAKQLAMDYIKQIAGALALRARSAPTTTGYEPLADAMARLSLCLRNPNVSEKELLQTIYLADLCWQEWFEAHTRFDERIAKEHRAALTDGDWIAVLGEFEITRDMELFNQLVGVRE